MKLEEMKELQNLRKRPQGVSLIGLALGKKISVEEEVVAVGIISCFQKQVLSLVDGGSLKSNEFVKRLMFSASLIYLDYFLKSNLYSLSLR